MARFFGWLASFVVLTVLVAAAAVAYLLHEHGRGLPDHSQLASYEPPVVTRVYAGDGRLLAEFAGEKRVFVPISAIPRHVVAAFLSAEDKGFYQHYGIDVLGIVRAAIDNVGNFYYDRRPVGASTITQQVAKNFLLGNEVSLRRKVKEAFLALRIEQALPKDRILELYLNEIYLGYGAYGVAAAALAYFNRSLDELALHEAAFLAALPKAPNNYHPVANRDAAIGRRDWVLRRMLEDRAIDEAAFAAAQAEPLQTRVRDEAVVVRADYYAEEVRREIAARYGASVLYGGGLAIRANLDPRLQSAAERSLRAGLMAYDRRHGWRGPVARLAAGPGWEQRLGVQAAPAGLGDWQVALVLAVDEPGATIGFADGRRGEIPFAEIEWARPALEGQRAGSRPRRAGDVVAVGDVVVVAQEASPGAGFPLRQIPNVEGALVAMDPHTGRVLAMVGGWSAERSVFNRATQAQRQPGSSFKPIVYVAALESGFSPVSLADDAPIVIDQGPGLPKWKPANYTTEFFGPSTLRLGIEKSRNLMTVRLARELGMDKVADFSRRFGVYDNLPLNLPMALGAGETTLMKLTTAYAMLVNGGRRVSPALIEYVQDRQGRIISRRDGRACADCRAESWEAQSAPLLADERPTVVGPISAYQMVSMLEGVVLRGTAAQVAALGIPLAGKTGTTNDYLDAWFIGFAPDLVVGVFVGFDTPKSLGEHETGSRAAVPIFMDFMREALAEARAIPFRIPPGVRLARIDPATGLPAPEGQRGSILEAFRVGSEPVSRAPRGPALDAESSGLY
ncbi:MAG: penicillin-binding protein 1A [Alphaproteobacteria bacterium]|nr:penicillin-binding protein 1A [Alphaproteobacteria bacterium]